MKLLKLNTNIMDKSIHRLEIEECKELLSYFPVLGLVGARQVGKTTLSKQLMQTLNKESVYFDLENPRDIAKLNDPLLYFENNRNKCIIIDEVQRMPELFPILRSEIDAQREPARYILLGSASPILMRDSTESLAGRVAYVELAPLLIEEVSYQNLNTHWLRGGFPDSFLATSDKISLKWRANFVLSYIERDLPMMGFPAAAKTTFALWTMLAHNQGNLINYQNFSKSLNISFTTLKSYLHFFENAFLIRELEPYIGNIKKRLVKTPKIYVRDSGIVNYLLNIKNYDDLIGNSLLGNLWEGYVIDQIINRLKDNFRYYFYRTHQGAELDLIIVDGNKVKCAIEIKYSSAPKLSKGNWNAIKDVNAEKNYVIIPTQETYLLAENIEVCNVDYLIQQLAV